MDVRRMTVEDCPAVRRRAMQMAAVLYPEMIEDVELSHQLLRDTVEGEHHTMVIGPPGAPTAAIVARVAGNLWATRKHAAILLWYSDTPGAGATLLRGFVRWFQEQKRMTLAGMISDCDIDPRVFRLMERIGFQRRGQGAWILLPRRAKQ